VKPEIMSPAGYWPQLRAAVEAGADSVYFGLKHFTARAKVGFSLEELPEVMRTLHQRGVRGYVTFNTLVFEHELAEAKRVLAAIAQAGVDAVIIQDVGVLRMVRELAPDLEVHASTQMSITNAEGVRLAQSLGVQRVTLARELSLDEIRQIKAATTCELEIFVHGALCVAYSGQCFSSEAWGGRSANRGQCAQACRLPYELLVDGAVEPLGDARYLLSPGDLYTLDQVPAMIAAGVGALKIEGRYKDAEYVALTTRAYRMAVDGGDVSGQKPLLEQVYSRGLGPFFLSGTNHQTVVEGRSPRHRGVRIGVVNRVLPEAVVVDLAVPCKPGDGLVFDAADWRSPQEREEGGNVYSVSDRGELRFANGSIDFNRIRPGDLVWRTHDAEVDKAAKPYTQGSYVRKQRVDVTAVARVGAPLRTVWTVGSVTVTVDSPEPLVAAQSRGLALAALQEQFSRLGNTAYELGTVELTAAGEPFVPVSLLNRVRREAVELLQERQAARPPVTINTVSLAVTARPAVDGPPQVHLLVRTPEQLEAAIAFAPASITLDYLDLYGLRPSLDRVLATGLTVRVATPRVIKPGEEKMAEFMTKLGVPLLVRSAGLVEALRGRTAMVGDFSLNAANSLTADAFLAMGLERITPTHDLNAEQVADLARRVGPEQIEAIAYQHLPVFHTEHCVFCRFLSSGTSYKDCGRPCEKHRVAVRDPQGRAHPVLADAGCRNTIFGAEAQEASAHLGRWKEAGIRHYRLEFAHESGAQVTAVAGQFQQALTHGRRVNLPVATTEGSLFVPHDYLTFPILQ
jgi:putative protease